MADTYTIKTAQQKLSALVDEAADHPVTITKQGRAVAVLISIERMEAIGETMELLADPNAMSAIPNAHPSPCRWNGLPIFSS